MPTSLLSSLSDRLPGLQLRPMEETHIPQVWQLQCLAYAPEFHESEAVFRAKRAAWPDCCWVLVWDERVLAYLFAQESRLGHPPCLHNEGQEMGARDCFHLHDLAIHPEFRGLGLGRPLIEAGLVEGRRRGLAWASLVAVQQSVAFWEKQGFGGGGPELCPPLSSYGPDARYLLRLLGEKA